MKASTSRIYRWRETPAQVTPMTSLGRLFCRHYSSVGEHVQTQYLLRKIAHSRKHQVDEVFGNRYSLIIYRANSLLETHQQ